MNTALINYHGARNKFFMERKLRVESKWEHKNGKRETILFRLSIYLIKH